MIKSEIKTLVVKGKLSRVQDVIYRSGKIVRRILGNDGLPTDIITIKK